MNENNKNVLWQEPEAWDIVKETFVHIWKEFRLESREPAIVYDLSTKTKFFGKRIAEAVVVHVSAVRNPLNSYLFNRNRRNISSAYSYWEQLSFLSLWIRLEKENIFDYFLTICAIAREVAVHCYHRNRFLNVLPLAPTFVFAFFKNRHADAFINEGGWNGLIDYIGECNYEYLYSKIKDGTSSSRWCPFLLNKPLELLAAKRREMLSIARSTLNLEFDREIKGVISEVIRWNQELKGSEAEENLEERNLR